VIKIFKKAYRCSGSQIKILVLSWRELWKVQDHGFAILDSVLAVFSSQSLTDTCVLKSVFLTQHTCLQLEHICYLILKVCSWSAILGFWTLLSLWIKQNCSIRNCLPVEYTAMCSVSSWAITASLGIWHAHPFLVQNNEKYKGLIPW